MSDLISRQAAIANAISGLVRIEDGEKWIRVSEVRESLLNMPSVEPERKKGKWLEMRYCDYYVQDLQMCRCSECGRYDFRPYLYYFSKPNFCSWCGAEMKGEAE